MFTSVPVQKVPIRVAERLATKWRVKTDEAKNVLRALHALHGENIVAQLREYLSSAEAWLLTEEAYVELCSLSS